MRFPGAEQLRAALAWTDEQLGQALEILRTRKRHFHITFEGPSGQRVLEELMQFCRAHESTYSSDARESALLEGRREVYLFIQRHLRFSSEELLAIYKGQTINVSEESEQ